jgi:hypothetical protein
MFSGIFSQSMSYSTYSDLLFTWMGLGLATFFLLLKITAPFGRHTSENWGPQIDNRLGWIIMEGTVIAVTGLFVFPAMHRLSVPAAIMAALFLMHYVNRAFIFPFKIKTREKKMPVVIMISAILFNVVNGMALGYFFSHFEQYAISWLTDWRFLSGLILFITGMSINRRADEALIQLRGKTGDGYFIPQGKLFSRVSCPNLSGEIVEWLGYAVMCWNLPALAFFIWTCANLIPRALAHHRWYREKFQDYPTERKALVPFLL